MSMMGNVSRTLSTLSLQSCATGALGLDDNKARRKRAARGEYNPRQAENQKRKIELLLCGPDNIGIMEMISRVGIEAEVDSDSDDDAFEAKWMVPVRGLNIKSKAKDTFNPEFKIILAPDEETLGPELIEDAEYYLTNWGCFVLCYDPHDKNALDYLDNLLKIVEGEREKYIKPYMPFKICVLGINSRPIKEELYHDEFEVADWCRRHHANLHVHQVLLAEAENFMQIEAVMRNITTFSYELREEQYEVMEMEEVFGLIDADGGGSISPTEFHDLLCLVGLGDTVHKDDSDAMILAIDEDGSGEVEFNEFLKVMQKKPIHQNTKEEMTRAFDNMCVGTASYELNSGNARLKQIQGWLELYKPKDATMNTSQVMEILERCESEIRPGTLNYLDFIEINS